MILLATVLPSKFYTQTHAHPTGLLFIPVLVLFMEKTTALIGRLECALLLCKWVRRMASSGDAAVPRRSIRVYHYLSKRLGGNGCKERTEVHYPFKKTTHTFYKRISLKKKICFCIMQTWVKAIPDKLVFIPLLELLGLNTIMFVIHLHSV